MLTKEQQYEDRIFTDEEIEKFSQYRFENIGTDNIPMVYLASSFGKQWVKYLESNRVADKKIVRRVD